MMKSATAICLSLAFAISSSNAANFEMLISDPKDVSSKGQSSTAGKCDLVNTDKLEKKGLLHSQDGQDKCLIQHYFPGICGGKYMEVGALDGDRFSNTFAFYNSPALGWKGVNVEVDPVSYAKLSKNRKNDIANVHAAVCSDPQVIHYAPGKFKAVGGIWEFSSEAQRERWWPGMTLEDTVPVQCTHLQVILDQTLGDGHHYFDFMSLDIEGAELSALQGLDFGRVGYGVIIIEKQGRGDYGEGMDKQIEELLNAVGYDRVADKDKACGHRDNWYVNRDFEKIYEGYRIEGSVQKNLRG